MTRAFMRESVTRGQGPVVKVGIDKPAPKGAVLLADDGTPEGVP